MQHPRCFRSTQATAHDCSFNPSANLPQVHGLLVGDRVTPPMEALCTHLHVFKSWSAVGGRGVVQY